MSYWCIIRLNIHTCRTEDVMYRERGSRHNVTGRFGVHYTLNEYVHARV